MEEFGSQRRHPLFSTRVRVLQNTQPRSQGHSSQPPLIVRRKTLVAAGQVTTQNLGGKKSVGLEGWRSILFADATNFVGFKSSA